MGRLITMNCSGVQCEALLPVEQDWLQLDVPDEASHLFCNLGCLQTWLLWARNKECSIPTQEESHDDSNRK